jgi:hypothetical protein
MAIGKTAGSLILAGAMWASAARFTVRHKHFNGGCTGVMTVDVDGVRFAGPKGHAWTWKYPDIQELKLGRREIVVVSYHDDLLRLGADRTYRFEGEIPAREIYGLLKDRMDQRLVAAFTGEPAAAGWSIPVKRLGTLRGSQGLLAFGTDSVVYSTDSAGQSRTWRYIDIDSISSSGPFQLTITTFERARSHYGDRKGFNFELKQPITEARYNTLWLEIERKNGRIQ